MFEPMERNVDESIRSSMEVFERAQVGEVSPLEPLSPSRILVALDGSSQDELSLAIAAALNSRWPCLLDVMDAREQVATNELAERAADSLPAAPVKKRQGDCYEQILAALDATKAELVIVPSPFGRDLEKVGTDSTGTAIDVLLARSTAPLLVVRKPYTLEQNPFRFVTSLVTNENEAAQTAARWSAGLVAPGGHLVLLLLLQEEHLESVRHTLESLDAKVEITPDMLEDALKRSHVRLHRALQMTAARLKVDYELEVRRDSNLADVLDLSANEHPLLVLAHERRRSSSHGNIQQRIRNSPHAVLVVPID